MDTMTINEKRAKLNNYCTDVGCNKCLLRIGGWATSVTAHDCLVIAESPESDLDLALGIIEGRIDVVEPEEDEINVDLNESDPMAMTIADIATLISKCEEKGVGCRIEFIPIKKEKEV